MNVAEIQESFQKLLEEHRKILYKICHCYCRSRDDRDDLAQEIVVQLWRSFQSYDGRCRFSTWMYRVALNVAISFYRRERVRTEHIITAEEPLLAIADETPTQPDEIRLLYQAIERLDPLNKALILLYLDGNSYAEIGEVLGITQTNVATKIGRLKETLRREFGAATRG